MNDYPTDLTGKKETIETPNGSKLTRVEGGEWTFEGQWEDYFPMRSDEGLETDIRSLRKDLEAGSEYDMTTGLYVPIDRARATFWLAMKEMTLRMRKEQANEREREAEAAWERHCGVWG